MASESKAVIYAAMGGNLLIAVTKFIAAGITGSSAMLSEGIHSVVDTGNQGLLLLGMKRAKRPADAKFPFGYGKEVYFWSFVVAMLIFSIGAGVSLYEGIAHVMHPEPMSSPMINYIVLGLGILFEGASWAFALHQFRKTKGKWSYVEAVQRGKDPSLFMVVFEDSAALLGLFIALLGVMLSQWTGNPVFDGVASIIIGLILAGTAIWLAIETKGLLIGESANSRVVEGIRRQADDEPLIEAVHEVLTMHMGPDFILVNISVRFDREATAEQIEQVVVKLDRAIKAEFEEVKRIFVEAESARGIDSGRAEHQPGQ
ncbi:cation diffusion facilitator family transporter [Larsenimonas rhizosphaerae]|uniref:Cation diffusion facilitator family transporter n=1 Tax=Larsenimonas rhizosphaerae TaxID=2944682 RepID=A0AA41ZER5_9GAMM|nr:cation diffusion facilitator family transporter [Larsenimonas rhizosphaerae]MCM2130557.1 cation diffusion facilitator family transporter [Larsenimonas rhizosphaerae]MCX2523261.1 cation diffusion facilitator family transporter [Larsenimonas rhizosphaerae]